MADKSINQLPVSSGLTDDGLLVVYQNNITQSIRGNLIKQFAQQGVESALADAKASGEFDGKDGEDGQDGKDGYTPVKGKDYFDGADGADGYTPQKGTDYWTDADKAEMVNDVLAALPAAEGVSV